MAPPAFLYREACGERQLGGVAAGGERDAAVFAMGRSSVRRSDEECDIE
jgi:hypothetical protein